VDHSFLEESGEILRLRREDSQMRKTRFTEEQVAFALRQAETGTPVAEVSRKMGVSEATYCNWKRKYGGLGGCELRCLKQLEVENARLKCLVADLSLDNEMLQDVEREKFHQLVCASWRKS
jgi:putative transposase